jgi:uncharacterized membrane protein
MRRTLAVHIVAGALALTFGYTALFAAKGSTLHRMSWALWPLDLADYRIGGLTKMFGLLRMQRRIEVRVDLRFVSGRNAA